jgi:hypothetical protein
MASSARSYGSTYKPGGTLQLSRGSITGRVVASGTDDMGRWCWTTYNGRSNRRLTVITAYQVCEGAPVHDVAIHLVPKKYSAGTQQYSMMIERGYPTSRTPRTQFKIDLKTLLQGFLNQHHEILLMGDFNEDLETSSDGLRGATMGLIDLMQVKIGHKNFSTHIDGLSRIDFVFATPRVVEACTHAGYEPFRHRFETDHRGFFLDLDNAVLFGNQTAVIQSPSQRGLTSKSFKHRKTYIASRWKYLHHHKWFERLQAALQQEQVPSTTLEALDRDWTMSAIAAEKKCQIYPAGPYSQEIAKLRRRKTVLSHLISSQKKGISFEHAIHRLSSDVTGLLPTSLEDCQREYRTLVKKLKDLGREDQGMLRKKELQFQMELKLMAGNKAGAKGIKNILKAEETREMQRQLKWAMPRTDVGITAVRVPTDGDYTTDHCKKCDSWKTLDDPTDVQEALQHRNQIHFGQKHGTFPTTPQFTDHVDWMASTITADMILNGEDPFEDIDIPDIARELLASFAHSSPLDAVTDKVTLEEWTGKMKSWKETTSTSPSGMHLGHHKTLIKPFHPENPPASTSPELLELESHRQDIAQAQVDLLNLAIKNQYTYERWHNVVNFLLAKEPGIPRCHNKLRVIHLYEADLNALIGIKWRQLIHHVTDNRLLSPWQCRGFPG